MGYTKYNIIMTKTFDLSGWGLFGKVRWTQKSAAAGAGRDRIIIGWKRYISYRGSAAAAAATLFYPSRQIEMN